LQQPAYVMICWSSRWSRQKQDRVARCVSVLPNAATASILAWWPICPAQACACNSSCMCVGSSVTMLTACGRSRRERLPAFVLPWARLTVRLCEAFQSLGAGNQWRVGNPTGGASGYSNVTNNDPSPYHDASNRSRKTGSRAWN
jgi:hypothetical protein